MLKDCKYFEGTGNFCSRVTAMRCDEFPECEFKYIAYLKAENKRLKEELDTYGATGVCEVCSDKASKLADKYLGCLQEIKAIAEELLEKGLEPQSVEHQLRLKGKRELASIILDLITKAEEE